jgi:hypothetical protein
VGVGAVTSTGILHALWQLPYAVPTPKGSLAEIDRGTLEGSRGLVEEAGDDVVRVYQPAGAVRYVMVPAASLARGIHRAASHPPTVRRAAMCLEPKHGEGGSRARLLELAKDLGVGVLEVSARGVHELVPSARPQMGRPAVFRWWQAELAYRNWLRSTEPTGTTAPSA